MAQLTRLENIQGNHFKFYSVRVKANRVRTTWGRIGTFVSKYMEHEFGNRFEAVEFYENRIEQKCNRGYKVIYITNGSRPPMH